MTHICVGKLTIIGSDNGLSPGRRQAIIWTNAGILLIRHLATNVSEILIGIQAFSFKKMYFKMSSAKWRPFCLGLNVLRDVISYPCPNFNAGLSEPPLKLGHGCGNVPILLWWLDYLPMPKLSELVEIGNLWSYEECRYKINLQFLDKLLPVLRTFSTYVAHALSGRQYDIA